MTKKNLVLAGLLSVTAIGGAAFAADSMRVKGPMRADTNGDGVVSRSEFFAAAETRFKKHDTNGDRVLSGDEMKDRAGRFARLDTNNDGKLSFAEAAVGTSARFARMDADKDSKLTPEEFGPARGPGRHYGPGMAQDDDARPAPRWARWRLGGDDAPPRRHQWRRQDQPRGKSCAGGPALRSPRRE